MPVRIEVAGLVAGMIVMLARLFGNRCVPMSVLIEIAGGVPRMVVVRPRLLRDRLVSVPMLIEIARRMTGVIVMRSWLLLGHCASPILRVWKNGCRSSLFLRWRCRLP
jgi:hypothetical protein